MIMGRSYMLSTFMILGMISSSSCNHVQPGFLSSNKCKSHEQQALLKLKNSFTKDPMNLLSSWVGDDCCSWQGVSCDDVTCNVIKLNLRSPPSKFNECGSSKSVTSLTSPALDSALLGLTELTHLDLSWNDFNGSRIPGFIGSLRQLRYLNLTEACYSGPFPPQLGHLSNLVHLDLSMFYSGTVTIPSRSLSWASNLSKLETLYLDGFDLSLAHDTMHVLSKLPSLAILSLSHCRLWNVHFSGFDINNTSTSIFRNLEHLYLSENNLDGLLRQSPIQKISSLISLSLDSNRFNGSIPLWLENLVDLEYLDLSYNSLSELEVNIWGIMGNPCNFKHLDLRANEYIKGRSILEPSANFNRCAKYKLEYLDLARNRIQGHFPSLLGQMKKMRYLDLSFNLLQGLISPSLAELSDLRYLDLSNNMLSGSVENC